MAMHKAVLKEKWGQACFVFSGRPASLRGEQELSTLTRNKSAWRTGAGSPEGGGQLVGRCAQDLSPLLQNNHTDLHTNKQTQNLKARTFKTESSC